MPDEKPAKKKVELDADTAAGVARIAETENLTVDEVLTMTVRNRLKRVSQKRGKGNDRR